MENKRPKSITIIAWGLIITSIWVGGCFLLMGINGNTKIIPKLQSFDSGLKLVVICLPSILSIISGIGMLKGQNWSRFLFVILSIAVFSRNLITVHLRVESIPGWILFLIITYLLFRPSANQYFVKH